MELFVTVAAAGMATEASVDTDSWPAASEVVSACNVVDSTAVRSLNSSLGDCGDMEAVEVAGKITVDTEEGEVVSRSWDMISVMAWMAGPGSPDDPVIVTVVTVGAAGEEVGPGFTGFVVSEPEISIIAYLPDPDPIFQRKKKRFRSKLNRIQFF